MKKITWSLPRRRKSELDQEIEALITKLRNSEEIDERYKAKREELEALVEVRTKMKGQTINPNTVISSMSNVLGLVLILRWEETRVITTKALQFAMRNRL